MEHQPAAVPSSHIYGLFSFTFGFISVFLIAPVFAGLAFIFGAIGLYKRQFSGSVSGMVLAIIGLVTSPLFWLLISDAPAVNLTLNGSVNGKQVEGYVHTYDEEGTQPRFKLRID